MDDFDQGYTKHLELGGTTLQGHFLLKIKGHFLKIKRVLLCLLQILEAQAPLHSPIATALILILRFLLKQGIRVSGGIVVTYFFLEQGTKTCVFLHWCGGQNMSKGEILLHWAVI